ncbi:MAG TPA: hypothetical protein VFU04_06310 [Solirubrobacterales bacterium]|nr:hypothetical protein [Solirubrobacterales bacterium]
MAASWLGLEIDDVDGARLGRIRAAFGDAGSGEATWLLVEPRRRLPLLRRAGGLVPVPARDCAAAPARAWTAHARSVVRTAPTVDPTRPLLREHELAICAHYGIGEAVGRAAEVVGRPADGVTSQPAFP